jgi:hypothetical protein
VGTVNDPQYAINTRTINTVLTIYDGDSVIIGGLISDEDRSTIQKIPLIGDMPALGRLFSTESSEVIKKDILMSITPVVIRTQDIPAGISGFWSGSAKQVSLDVPAEEKIIQESNFNDIPATDYIMAVSENEFLPSDNYFSIQVFSSKDEDEATSRSKELQDMEFKTWIRPAEIKDKGTFFRVFVGQYSSYQKAEEIRQDLLKNEIFPKDINIVDRTYVYGQ